MLESERALPLARPARGLVRQRQALHLVAADEQAALLCARGGEGGRGAGTIEGAKKRTEGRGKGGGMGEPAHVHTTI